MARVSDPYASDEDDNVDGLVNEMNEDEGRERRSAPVTGPSNDDDDYELDEADTADEFEVQQPGRARTPRDSRRQERSGFQEAYRGAREDNDRLRRERDNALANQQYGRERESVDHAKAEYDQRLSAAREERSSLIDNYNRGMATGGLSDQQQADMREKAFDMDQRIAKLNNDEWAREREPSEHQRRRDALNAQLSARAPDIYSNKVAQGLLIAKYGARKAGGARDSMELHDRCCEEVRDEMNLRSEDERPEPTERERARYAGSPRGGTRGGGKGRQRAGTYKMSDMDRQLADISHSHIKEPNKRYQAWVNSVRPDITD